MKAWRGLNEQYRAIVTGSDGRRTYNVIVTGCGRSCFKAYSDDNGTVLRGYVGYPIIAVLILMRALPRDERVEAALRGIPWRALNEKYRRYSRVIEKALETARERGVEPDVILSYVERCMSELKKQRIYYDPSLLES